MYVKGQPNASSIFIFMSFGLSGIDFMELVFSLIVIYKKKEEEKRRSKPEFSPASSPAHSSPATRFQLLLTQFPAKRPLLTLQSLRHLLHRTPF